MLVLSRRLHEKVLLPDLHISVEVVGIDASRVRLGITAPPEVTVLREELQGRQGEWTKSAARSKEVPLREIDLRAQLHAITLAAERLRTQLVPGQSQLAYAALVELNENIRLLRESLGVGTPDRAHRVHADAWRG